MVEKAPDGSFRVKLAGAIDEDADLVGLFKQLDGDVVFNMQDVTRVNSMGVHRWIPLLAGYSARHRVEIDDISYALVQNANVVANLFGSALVRSCMAPYFCGRCKENNTARVAREDVLENDFAPPTRHCMRCDSPMEFDELDGYFAFFKRLPRR